MNRMLSSLRFLPVFAATVVAMAGPVAAEARDALRVCADPNNLPFSHKNGTGFENRLAELWAGELALPLEYTWFPQRRGFVRNTLRAEASDRPGYKCDVIIGVVSEFDQAITTKPYYRSTYALVYVKGRKLDDVKTGADLVGLTADRKKGLRIGVFTPSPGVDWLGRHDMVEQMVAFPVMSGDPEAYPGQIIENELVNSDIDAAIVWGPIAGYFAKTAAPARLAVIPLASEPGIRFEFAISAGVRYGDGDTKRELETLIDKTEPRIRALLEEFNVPLVAENGQPTS